jgi:uncharacterized membrane protein YGL010W
MRTADEWFEAYGDSHQNPTNKKIHWLCVPLIVFSTIGLFWSIPHTYFEGVLPGAWSPLLNWGTILVVVTLLFYLRMSFSLFLGMSVYSGLCVWGNYALLQWGIAPLWMLSAGIFIVMWIGQFIGHEIEGKKPSFLEDLQFLLIGPAWLMHFIYKKVGLRY